MIPRLVFPLFLVLSGFSVPVQSAPELSPSPLTLAAALQRAAEQHPRLAERRSDERAMEARRDQAGLRPNATVDVALENVMGTGALQGVRSLETTVQAQQTLERGGKREKRVAVASREHETAVWETAASRAEVLAATAAAYVAVVAAQQRLLLAAEPVALARETLETVTARVQAGAGSLSEAARARAAMASAQAELARCRAQLQVARAALANQWGGSPDEVGSLPGRVRMPEALPERQLLLTAIDRHARLELQRSIIAGRRASLELEQAQAVPDLTVGGGIRFLREGSDAAFVAGVSMPLMRRNQNQGMIRAARETVTGAEWALRAAETTLRAEFSAAWQELQAAADASRLLRRDALPATDEALTIVRRAYQDGQLPLIDVLDAQREQVLLRRELLELESEFALALARIDGLTSSTFPLTTALLISE
ncbi:MAG: TolC family protein [Opitutaceae bacterium]